MHLTLPDMNSSEEHNDSPRPTSKIRPVAWTVLVLVPLLFPIMGHYVLVGLWCIASVYLVAVPSRVDDEIDPDGRRAAVKVAFWLFGIIAAFVAWHWTVFRSSIGSNLPEWFFRIDLVPHDLGLAINLFFALLGLAPVTAVFVLSQRRFLFRPDSPANRLLLLLGIPLLVLVCAGAWDFLYMLICIV